MTIANITCIVKSDVQSVWEIVCDLKKYDWRSDLGTIEIIEEDKKFIEYGKDNFATTFTITKKEPMTRYEFDIENKNMSGHWIGLFRRTPQGTQLDFTEDVCVKNPIMKLFVKAYLRKQQKQFVNDLKRALGELDI